MSEVENNIIDLVTSVDSEVLDELCRVFKVSKEICNSYNQCYNSKILRRIQRNYLAHFVMAVEEMIDEIIRAEIKKGKRQDTPEKKLRRYNIILSCKTPPPNGRVETISFPFGAIINYEPRYSDNDLRLIIAHELGHMLIEYGIIPGDNYENYANVLAYFAVFGKNEFYKFKAPTLIYHSEKEIISKIQAVCPIIKEKQVDK